MLLTDLPIIPSGKGQMACRCGLLLEPVRTLFARWDALSSSHKQISHSLCPQKAKKETKPWLIKGPRRTEASQVSGAGASFWSSAHGFKSKKARNVKTRRDVTLQQKWQITPDQRLILRSSSRAHRWTWYVIRKRNWTTTEVPVQQIKKQTLREIPQRPVLIQLLSLVRTSDTHSRKSSLKLSQELLQNPYGYLTPDK